MRRKFYSLLGGRIHIRLDVLLTILIPDMLTFVDEFSNAFFSRSTKSKSSLPFDSSASSNRRLKPIEERWRQQCNRRDHGYYTQAPKESVMNDLLSTLLAPIDDVNSNLRLPTVSPTWLNIAIRLLLSVRNSYHHARSLPSHQSSCPLLDVVTTFIDDWFTAEDDDSQGDRSSITKFSLPIDQPTDLTEISLLILERILVPLLPCELLIKNIYFCKHCKTTFSIVSSISSLSVNVNQSGLHLERELCSFFSPTISDMRCPSCEKPYIRHTEVVQWPSVLIINVNDVRKNVEFRQPPGAISLAQFANWLSISCPSSSVYNLICFNSILRAGDQETMVQATRIKKSWSTNINRRLIGAGEQLRRLFANSRKFLSLLNGNMLITLKPFFIRSIVLFV